MKVALYINGKKADLSDDSFVLFSYRYNDMANPTDICNGYTKPLTLPGTPTNNDIFAHVYRNDFTSGLFVPLQRTPFKIFNELSEVLESGYLKLDSVQTAGGIVSYSVTLFGGLGGVIYSLMYDTLGNKLSLADLDYNIGTNDVDFDFPITKSAVKEAWDRITGDPANVRWDTINFAPCYNGYPSTNFSADKMIVPSSSIPGLVLPITVDDKTYDGQGGYVKVDLGKQYDEWSTRDLRSYLQRPVISTQAIIQAIVRRLEAAGYDVELDDTFFDGENEYYANTWLTLPILNELETKTESEDIPFSTTMPSFKDSMQYRYDVPNRIPADNPKTFRVIFKPRAIAATADTLYRTYLDGSQTGTSYITQVMVAQVVAYNQQGQEFTHSDIYLLGSSTPSWADVLATGYTPHSQGTPSQMTAHLLTGYFQHDGGGNVGEWVSTSQDSAVDITINDTVGSSVAYIVLYVDVVRTRQGGAWGSLDHLVLINSNASGLTAYGGSSLQTVDGAGAIHSGLHVNNYTYSVRSGVTITKQLLLGGTDSPADYLIAFIKMFGLVMTVDDARMSVRILERDNYFTEGSKIDINDHIDRSKPMDVRPYAVEDRWYRYGLPLVGGSFVDYYSSVYGKQYGERMVNTGYEFNANINDVLSSLTLKGYATVLERSKYFYDAVLGSIHATPAMLDGGNSITLWSGSGDTYAMDCPVVDGRYTITPMNTALPGYDKQAKPQFHDDEYKPIDGKNCLLFYDGWTIDAAYQQFCLTDDTAIMSIVNDGIPCWIGDAASVSPTYRVGGGVELPIFRAHIISGTSIVSTLEFGVPAELPIPTITSYSEERTVYQKAWKAYIADLYDADARVVTCYVNLRGLHITADALKNFYWFDGCWWVLNAIEDYSLTTDGTTKCEFIKVKSMTNYTNGQQI